MNNIELVEYVKRCLELGDNSVYVYGTYGKTLIKDLCDSKHKQYPNVNTDERTTRYKKLCDGKHIGFDCVGLIKSFYWGGYPTPKYNGSSDVSANGMYDNAKVKGNINTLDKSRIGLLVQMNGHIGIYVGNDEVIECTISTHFAKQSHGLGGVCKTKLSDRPWEHWCECPYIEYIKENNEEKKEDNTEYYEKTPYTGVSIVDGLKAIKVDSSYLHRDKIAKANDINNYRGTAEQNSYMLKLLKQGKLKKEC